MVRSRKGGNGVKRCSVVGCRCKAYAILKRMFGKCKTQCPLCKKCFTEYEMDDGEYVTVSLVS